MDDILASGLAKLGLDAGGKEAGKLRGYIAEILLWNKRYNLVGSTGDDLIIRHILDSLSAVDHFRTLPGTTIADVGSGAGLPGIPLSIFLPEKRFFLIERSAKRAAFLRNCKAMLSLSIEVIDTGIEEVTEKFDIVTSRAFRDFAEFHDLLLKITASGGFLTAYKGRKSVIQEELAGVVRPNRIIPLSVPFLNEERHLLVIGPV